MVLHHMEGTGKLFWVRLLTFCLAIAIVSLFLTSCVYFNTFYNAQKYYKKAEKDNEDRETDMPPQLQNYQRALDTAAKVPEFYPDSKYVDDALMLMGKCYFYMENYPKAQRKFEELITNYEKSDFIEEAQLYLGKSLIENKKFDRARDVLNTLANTTEDKKLAVEAKFALGNLLYTEENFTQAADVYTKLAGEVSDKEKKSKAYYLAGECNTMREDYQAAAESYKKSAELNKGSQHHRFYAYFNWAVSLRKAGDLTGAKTVIEIILKNQKLYDYYPIAKVEEADINRELGEVDEAMGELEKITLNNPNTYESARAFYIMGMMQRDNYYDYEKAEENLNKVRTEKNDSPFADSAGQALDVLNQWKTIKFSIDSVQNFIEKDENWLLGIVDTTEIETDTTYSDAVRDLFNEAGGKSKNESPPPPEQIQYDPSMPPEVLERLKRDPNVQLPPEILQQIERDSLAKLEESGAGIIESDSLSAVVDSLGVSDDSLIVEETVIDTADVLENIENNKNRLRELKYQKAEIWYYQLGNIDSSIILLTEIADSAEAELASKSLFLLAHIYKQEKDTVLVDSIYSRIVDDYDGTPYSRPARKWLGLPLLKEKVDSAKVIFMSAESTFFKDGDIADAWDQYALVDSLYPESEYAPKAIFARAMLAQKELYDDSTAVQLLRKLKEDYPQDTLGIIADRRTQEPPEEIIQEVEEETEEGEESAFYLPDEVDETAVCSLDSAGITEYLKTSGLYPQNALSAGMKGLVEMTVVIDKYGYPGDMELTKEVPTGYGFGDAAMEAVENFEFTAGKLDNAPVPVQIELKFYFVP